MMQYDGTSFSMNGNATMVSKNPSTVQLGNEVGFTKIDSVQAMLLYNCQGDESNHLLEFAVRSLQLEHYENMAFTNNISQFKNYFGNSAKLILARHEMFVE